MKLKYYIRGLGVGIIATTIILTISNSVRLANLRFAYNNAQNETNGSVIAYTTAADQATQPAGKEPETTAPQPTTAAPTSAAEPVQQDETVSVEIRNIYYASEAAELLYNAGVIDDQVAFAQYMEDNGYATQIREDVYEFTKGDTYENIAQIITKSR